MLTIAFNALITFILNYDFTSFNEMCAKFFIVCIVTRNVKISLNVHPPMSDSGTLDVHVIGHEVDLASIVD